jgi:hypothetical protein
MYDCPTRHHTHPGGNVRRLSYVLFQLDQAKQYIQDGRLEHLRLALLLLDNAAEIQMEQQINAKLVYEEFKQRMKDRLDGFSSDDLPPRLAEIAEWDPLTRAQKEKVRRYFDEAVKFLSERHSGLDERLAGSLSYLHRYRNEAYHRARVRKETIRTAALLLLEVNCRMLLSMPPPMITWSSNEDYTWFEDRFGASAMGFDSTHGISEVVQDIRSGVSPNDESVAKALKDHLDSRIQELHESLDFIADSIPGNAGRAEALRDSQYAHEVDQGRIKFIMGGWEHFQPKYTLESITKLRQRTSEILKAQDCLDAFVLFAQIEKELEPIENPVRLLETEIERDMQLQIDIARGK